LKWFKAAADQGQACAQWYLGECYRVGTGVIQDPFEATAWFRMSAEQGYIDAQNSLGEMLRDYPCIDEAETTKKRQEAKKWFRLAAEQGNVEAQFNLGDLLSGYYGDLEKDFSGALKWFKLAARNGNKDARQKIKFCKDKLQSAEDTDGTVKFLRAKAEGGDAEAQFDLSSRYYTGKGVQEDRSLSLQWLEKAAEQGHEKALEVLVRRRGLDAEKVAHWCRKAAKQELTWAMYDLAGLYFHGKGMSEDRARAVALYQNLAKSEASDDMWVAMARYSLGQIAKISDPCPYSEMMMWFEKAAHQGLDLAQRELAQLFAEGFGEIQLDYFAAYTWYELYFLCGGEDNFNYVDFRKASLQVRRKLAADQIKNAEEKAKALYAKVTLGV
jgi:TPR repeat protein